jgi:drug/metabolite transporter (DMT)-like permease
VSKYLEEAIGMVPLSPKRTLLLMNTVFLGLTVALLWGSADTLATYATRKIGTAITTFVAQIAGFLLVAVFGLACAGRFGLLPLPAHALNESVLWGVVLGGVSAGAYLTLYEALSTGPLAVASPVVSAQGGVTLLLAVMLLHERLGSFQLLFLLLTFVGVMLASLNVRELAQLHLRALFGPGVRFALISLLCFGVLAFGLGLAARQSNWFLSVLLLRCFSCLFITLLKPPDSSEEAGQDSSAWGYLLAALVGCFDMGGLAVFSLATASGSIGVAGMICSAYGVIPLLAGVFLLRERIHLSQVLGCLWLVIGLAGEAAPTRELAVPLTGMAAVLAVGCGLVVLYKRSGILRTRFTARPWKGVHIVARAERKE